MSGAIKRSFLDEGTKLEGGHEAARLLELTVSAVTVCRSTNLEASGAALNPSSHFSPKLLLSKHLY